MDWTNLARELFTLFCFASFLLFCWIAYSKSSKKRYQDVASMIIEDDDTPKQTAEQQPCNGAK
jgi:cytochrome c oxidase cbb3-type subunit 4